MSLNRRASVVAALLLLGATTGALAAESAPVVSKRATATLVSETDAVDVKPFRVALRLRLAPGWHTYWSNPGDAGIPAELTFALPAGLAAGPVMWPAPDRQPEGDLLTYGYSNEVLLPSTVTGAGASGASMKLHASWLVCSNICVPEEGDFTLDLPAGTPAPSAQAALFAAADLRTPRPSPFAARIAPDGLLSIAMDGSAAASVRDAWFIPAAPDSIASSPQTLAIRPEGLSLRLTLAAGRAKPLTGVLAIADRAGQTSFWEVSAPDGPPEATGASLPAILGLALLGGLILNLMPCVFPVLALKAVGLARLSGGERSHARGHAVAYAAGVVLTFVGLGAALLALRNAGAAAGWGFQFQSPVFVGGMALLLFGVGLNLSGVYRIGGLGLAGAGQSLAGRDGLAGSFFAGLLAVLVATPCTAPFMAPAIAAGLAASPAAALAVFAALGVGLAAPYALLAGLPALARALPRPGAWMEILRQALAFPMYGAAVWLFWVLSQQSGPSGVLAAGVGCLLVGFAAWMWGLSQDARQFGRRPAGGLIGGGLALAAILGAIVVVAGLRAAPAEAASNAESFTAARLAALRDAGRPVFVNMTAAWCVTCLVNERIALAPEAVRGAFAARGVAYLKGDWTRPNPEITAFLRDHARDGVPLYVMYPGGHGAPRILPQILTEGTVLAALR